MTTQLKQDNNNKPNALQNFLIRLGIIGELLAFLWKRKLYWMIPLVVSLLVIAIVIVVGSSSPLGAFIYPLL